MSLIDQTLAPFEKDLASISKMIESELIMMLSNYDSVGGKLLNNNVNMRMTVEFAKSFKEILDESGYNDMAKKFADSNSDVINKLQKLSIGTALPLEFTKTDMATFKTLETINFDDLFRIGKDAGDVLLTELRADVLTGQTLRKTKIMLRRKLKRNLRGHADTYMTTARNQLIQKAEILGIGKRKDVMWEYAGPRDNKNREECVIGLSKQYFTKKGMEEFQANYGLRWNCRHIFMAVLKEDIESGT